MLSCSLMIHHWSCYLRMSIFRQLLIYTHIHTHPHTHPTHTLSPPLPFPPSLHRLSCISPVMAASLFPGVEVTVGHSSDPTAVAIGNMGATHVHKPVTVSWHEGMSVWGWTNGCFSMKYCSISISKVVGLHSHIGFLSQCIKSRGVDELKGFKFWLKLFLFITYM